MVKYRITGPDASAYLNRLTMRNAAKLAVGSEHYTASCDDAGKVLDDGTLFRHRAEDYLLCCQERHLPWLLDSAIGYAVQVREVAKEALPCRCRAPVPPPFWPAGFDVSKLKPFRMASNVFNDAELTISCTGLPAIWVKNY